MSQLPEDHRSTSTSNEAPSGSEQAIEGRPAGGVKRRDFLHAMGAVGAAAVGAASLHGVSGTELKAAEPSSEAPQSQDQDEFPRPVGLRPGAQLDCRWPVTYVDTIPESVRLVTRYFAAWSERDLDGLAAVMHFPFAIIEQIEPIVYETPEDFLSNPPLTLAPEGMEVNHPGHFTGRIAPGSYNLLDAVDVPLFSPVGAAVTLQFTRYSESGYRLLECDGLFAVTNNDGRWGIEMVSTILKPADHAGVAQHDVEMAARRDLQDNYLEYTNRHLPPPPRRDPIETTLRTASVSIGSAARNAAVNARNGDPMAIWSTAGVPSRLSVSEQTQDATVLGALGRMGYEDADPEFARFTRDYDFPQFADTAGGNVGDYGDSLTTPMKPMVLGNGRHANQNKAHTWGAYMRHTTDLTMISDSRRIHIRVRKDGQWWQAGSIGTVMFHDRSNSYEQA